MSGHGRHVHRRSRPRSRPSATCSRHSTSRTSQCWPPGPRSRREPADLVHCDVIRAARHRIQLLPVDGSQPGGQGAADRREAGRGEAGRVGRRCRVGRLAAESPQDGIGAELALLVGHMAGLGQRGLRGLANDMDAGRRLRGAGSRPLTATGGGWPCASTSVPAAAWRRSGRPALHRASPPQRPCPARGRNPSSVRTPRRRCRGRGCRWARRPARRPAG